MEAANTTALYAPLDLPELAEPDTAYVRNMRALWEVSPRLAVAIDQVDDLDLVDCQPTRSGEWTCQLPGPSDKPVYVHSRYDPVREAAAWADGAEALARQVEQRDDSNRVPMCYLVDGFGLGYHVRALFERLSGDAFVVVSEPNLALLRTALTHLDHSAMLASERLIILTSADRQEIFQKLQAHSHAMMMGVVFTRPLQRRDAAFHQQVHQLVSEYASYLRSHMISLLANGIVTCENILRNLPTYVATPSISMLKNRFRDCPAVVVSAGPSLRRHLERLKQVRDRVVVIAVQTVLKPLLNYGIVPDFVTSLDYHPVCRRFFEGLTAAQLRDVHLVAEPKANYSVIDYYAERGPVSLLGNDFARGVLGGRDPHDSLPAGATVAHLCFYLAQYLGADPIIFIGQDLAFTDNVYYSPGNALHAVWGPEFNRFSTIEMKEWERIVRHRNILRKVRDIHDQEIYTDEQMFTYLQQFERDFANATATVIDASEGGALKRNCQTMTFAAALEQYARAPIDRQRFDYREEMTQGEPGHRDAARAAVESRLEQVREFREISRETVALVREMLELLDDQPALNRKMVRLDELRTKVKHRGEVYNLVMHVSQAAEMYRFRADRRLGVSDAQGKERQRRQLQRDIGYVGEIEKGCDRLIKMLEDCRGRFDSSRRESA